MPAIIYNVLSGRIQNFNIALAGLDHPKHDFLAIVKNRQTHTA